MASRILFKRNNNSGVTPSAGSLVQGELAMNTADGKVFLKAPITTPQGGGYKSLNVSTRKFLGLYANIRPCFSFGFLFFCFFSFFSFKLFLFAFIFFLFFLLFLLFFFRNCNRFFFFNRGCNIF